jgi:hypothetical protein
MALSIRAIAEAVNQTCSYLAGKPTGATPAAALSKLPLTPALWGAVSVDLSS